MDRHLSLRVLCVAPLGSQPWVSTVELVAAIESLGHEAFVVGDAANPLPWPQQYRPGDGQWIGLTPHLLRDRSVAWLRFVRDIREMLKARRPDVVLVWDEATAMVLRLTRPRGARLVFVASEYMPATRRERVERAGAIATADAVVVPTPGATSINLARQIVAGVADGVAHASTSASSDSWVVLASGQPLDDTLAALSERAESIPATAVIVDGRSAHEPSFPVELLSRVTGAAEVVVARDDSWIEQTRPATVIDPSASFWVEDHRHRAAMRASTLLIPARAPVAGGALASGVVVGDAVGEWKRVTRESDPSVAVETWARKALIDPLCPRAELVATTGLPVTACPTCGSAPGKLVRTVGPTTVTRCAACTLVYASPKVPDDLVYDDGYHDGSGAFGTDYVHAQWYCERLSEDRLRCLERAGVAAGRMVDIGTGLGHFVAVARKHGWECDGVELVPAAIDEAKKLYGFDLIQAAVLDFAAEPGYDVAALGQTLEHFVDPGAVLRHIRDSVVRPGGAVLLEVPHFGGLTRRLQRQRWSHWQPGDHVLFLESQSMQALLDRNGYDLVYAETVSGVYPGLGAVGVAYALGLFNPLSSTGSLLRTLKRVATTRITARLPYRASVAAPTALADGLPSGGPAERLLLALAERIDAAGYGDHLRVVARAR